MRTYVSQFTHKGQEIELLYYKGKISYVFNWKDKRFGNAVKCESKSIKDIINATAALMINYLETLEAVEKKHVGK